MVSRCLQSHYGQIYPQIYDEYAFGWIDENVKFVKCVIKTKCKKYSTNLGDLSFKWWINNNQNNKDIQWKLIQRNDFMSDQWP